MKTVGTILFFLLSTVLLGEPPTPTPTPAPIVWHISTLPFVGIPTTTKNYYISPTGSTSNSGLDPAHPKTFDLVKGCSACSDTTIFALAGKYDTVADGARNLNLYGAGVPGSPLIVRPYEPAPFQRAAISFRVNANKWFSGFSVAGHDVWYIGAEWTPVTGTNTNRITSYPGSTPGPDMSHYGLAFNLRTDLGPQPGIRFIAGVMHDNLQGPSPQSPQSPDFELSDSLVYYNGWFSTADRSHGHGIYLQGPCGQSTGNRYINTIVQHNFHYGFHAYGSSAICNNDLTLDGMDLGPTGDMPTLNQGGGLALLGGTNPTMRPTIKNSLFYNPVDNNNFHIGYSPWSANTVLNGHITSNAFAAGLWFEPGKISLPSMTVTGNSFRALPIQPYAGYTQGDYPSNDWLTTSGHGYVRPSQYLKGYAHVSVWNKDAFTTVSVPFAATGVQVGAPYEIRYGGNYYGPKITGVYAGGDVSFPMTGWTEALPDGNISPPPSPLPYYATFIVQQTGPAGPTPTPTSTATATLTPTNTNTPTATFTGTLTPTNTPTATFTPSNTLTPTNTLTPSDTPTTTPTLTATNTQTATPSVTPATVCVTVTPSNLPPPPTTCVPITGCGPTPTRAP